MNDELKNELETLKKGLEGKTSTEVKAAIEAFEVKNAEVLANEVKSVKDAFTGQIEGLKADLKATQDHADSLDVKMQGKSNTADEVVDEVKSVISKNFDLISKVRKGQEVKLELKAVGDMTLGANLTGDQPRVYQERVAAVPAQAINFADLVSNIPMTGGTLTYPRETASEGSVSTQTEGSDKSQIDYDFAMIDANTDFLAGFAVYSKKMANNLPFLESFLPTALRRDYFKAENNLFYTELSGLATASTLTSGNVVERIVAESTTLMTLDYVPNIVVVSPQDYGNILVTAGPAGTGDYSLPGVVTISNGMININGIMVVVASWMPADKYIIGDWTKCAKVTTQGLGVEFFEQDGDNVRKNNITARVESQIALATYRPDAFIFGDFTTVV